MSEKTEYRERLLNYQAEELDIFGKQLVTLSGGALGLSVVFVRQIAGNDPSVIWLLGSAWVLWIASITCVLVSHYYSAQAMENAIEQLDSDEAVTGGKFDARTRWLNRGALWCFVVAAALAAVFVLMNVGE